MLAFPAICGGVSYTTSRGSRTRCDIGNLLFVSASVHADSAVMAPTRIMRTIYLAGGLVVFAAAGLWMTVTSRVAAPVASL